MTEYLCMVDGQIDHEGLQLICDPDDCELDCPLQDALNELDSNKFIVFSLIEEVPEYFVEHAKHETRTGVDSWDLWRFSDWFTKLKSTIRSDKGGSK